MVIPCDRKAVFFLLDNKPKPSKTSIPLVVEARQDHPHCPPEGTRYATTKLTGYSTELELELGLHRDHPHSLLTRTETPGLVRVNQAKGHLQ